MKNCFIFSGQGSHRPGMSLNLYKTFQIAKDRIELSNKILGYDPLVKVRKSNLNFSQFDNITNVVKKSDIIILMTNWKNLNEVILKFKNINLKKKIILDPYGLLNSFIDKNVKEYFTLGKKN